MSKSSRRREAEMAFKARMDAMRESGLVIAVDGRTLEPGSLEYERELKHLLQSTSPDELVKKPPKSGN